VQGRKGEEREQWLNVMGRKGTPFPTYNVWVKASPTQNCYKKHTTTDGGQT